MNYGTLRADLASFLQRDDMTAVIPTMVRYATAQFNRVLRLPQMQTRDTRIVTSEFVTLPTDFLEVISVVRSSDGKEIRYAATPTFNSYVSQGVRPDPPIFTVEDYQLRFLPAPTAGSPLTVTIQTYERIPELTTDPSTNWLLTQNPDLYMLGSLLYARLWLHDDARLGLVKAMYDEQLAILRRTKVHATGIVSAIAADVPTTRDSFDIVRGY